VTLVPAAATVRAKVAVCVSEPEVPVKTTLAIAAAAVLPALRVTVWGAPGASVTRVGVLVTSAGRPLRATVVVPVKPLSAVAVT
jgi:hypothetical protein